MLQNRGFGSNAYYIDRKRGKRISECHSQYERKVSQSLLNVLLRLILKYKKKFFMITIYPVLKTLQN